MTLADDRGPGPPRSRARRTWVDAGGLPSPSYQFDARGVCPQAAVRPLEADTPDVNGDRLRSGDAKLCRSLHLDLLTWPLTLVGMACEPAESLS